MMTPLQIEIAIHYRCRPTDFRDGEFGASAVREAIDWFLKEGLIELTKTKPPLGLGYRQGTYRGTDRLRAYVEALERVPLPVQIWTTPSATLRNCTDGPLAR